MTQANPHEREVSDLAKRLENAMRSTTVGKIDPATVAVVSLNLLREVLTALRARDAGVGDIEKAAKIADDYKRSADNAVESVVDGPLPETTKQYFRGISAGAHGIARAIRELAASPPNTRESVTEAMVEAGARALLPPRMLEAYDAQWADENWPKFADEARACIEAARKAGAL